MALDHKNQLIECYNEIIRILEMMAECIKKLTNILYKEIHKKIGDGELFELLVQNIKAKECVFNNYKN